MYLKQLFFSKQNKIYLKDFYQSVQSQLYAYFLTYSGAIYIKSILNELE